jgi:hypothetical protein
LIGPEIPEVLVFDVDDFASVDASSRNNDQSRETQTPDADPLQSLADYKNQ